MELYSENATQEEILDAFYAMTLDCDIHEAKAPVLGVPNLMGLEARDPIGQKVP